MKEKEEAMSLANQVGQAINIYATYLKVRQAEKFVCVHFFTLSIKEKRTHTHTPKCAWSERREKKKLCNGIN